MAINPINRIRKIVSSGLINPQRTSILISAPEIRSKDVTVKLAKNASALIFQHNKTKEIVETHVLYDVVKKNSNIHGIPLKEALLAFYRNGKNRTYMRFDPNSIIERTVTKDFEKGIMQIDHVARQQYDTEPVITSIKRKIISFDTNGKHFLRHKGTLEMTLQNQDKLSFKPNQNNKKLQALFVSLPDKYFSKKPADIDYAFNAYFGDTLNNFINKPSKLRKLLLDGVKKRNVKSWLSYEFDLPYKLIPSIKSYKKGVAVRLENPYGELKETHNIFSDKYTNFYGIPMPEAVMMFLKGRIPNTGMVLSGNRVINREIHKDFQNGKMNVLYTLSRAKDRVLEPISQLVKYLKFEMKDGKPKKLLQRSVEAYDDAGEKGFVYHLDKAKKLGIRDYRGYTKEFGQDGFMQKTLNNWKKNKADNNKISLFESISKSVNSLLTTL